MLYFLKKYRLFNLLLRKSYFSGHRKLERQFRYKTTINFRQECITDHTRFVNIIPGFMNVNVDLVKGGFYSNYIHDYIIIMQCGVVSTNWYNLICLTIDNFCLTGWSRCQKDTVCTDPHCIQTPSVRTCHCSGAGQFEILHRCQLDMKTLLVHPIQIELNDVLLARNNTICDI